MEITKEALISLGFDTNHPERLFPNYYIHGKNPEYRIIIEQVYLPNTNKLIYKVDATLYDENNRAIKRAYSEIQTVDGLEEIANFLGVKLEEKIPSEIR